MSSFKVGEKIRVNNENIARVAIISFVNERDSLYDVIYDNNAEEAANLSENMISRLESFEYDVSTDPLILKEHGNILFGKCDYISAHSYYTNSLSLLTKQSPIQIGSNIIIQRNKTLTDYSVGMISDINGSSVDIMYDNTFDSGAEEEDLGIDVSQVTVTVPKFEELQRSLYLNLCRCSMKQGLYGWAVTWSSRAIALSTHLIQQHISTTDTNNNNTSLNKLNKQLSDGYYLRASSLLSAHRPYLARRDVIHLLSVQPKSVQPADPRAAQLTRDIDRFLYNRKMSYKKLAKQVAQWVDQAMNTNQQLSHEGTNDICIAADDDDVCADEAEVATTNDTTSSSLALSLPSSAHIQSNNTSANMPTKSGENKLQTQPVMTTLSTAMSFIVICLAVVLLFSKLI